MILPAHPKPYSNELFSSWLIRLAHANGLKVQTFCHLLFPHYEIWNRDIDRHAPDWLVNTLAEKRVVQLLIFIAQHWIVLKINYLM